MQRRQVAQSLLPRVTTQTTSPTSRFTPTPTTSYYHSFKPHTYINTNVYVMYIHILYIYRAFSVTNVFQNMVRLLQLGHTTRRPAVRKHSLEDSPAMCRQRRRRRIEMRRTRTNWPPVRTTLPKRRSAEKDEEGEENDDSDSDAGAALPRRWRLFRSPMPSYSEISMTCLAERSHVGGGAAWVQEDFCSPDVFSGGEALHFFAVYDGHVRTRVTLYHNNKK